MLDRDWFTQFTGRDLTDAEWELIAAELATSSNVLHDACADQLFDYVATALTSPVTTGRFESISICHRTTARGNTR